MSNPPLIRAITKDPVLSKVGSPRAREAGRRGSPPPAGAGSARVPLQPSASLPLPCRGGSGLAAPRPTPVPCCLPWPLLAGEAHLRAMGHWRLHGEAGWAGLMGGHRVCAAVKGSVPLSAAPRFLCHPHWEGPPSDGCRSAPSPTGTFGQSGTENTGTTCAASSGTWRSRPRQSLRAGVARGDASGQLGWEAVTRAARVGSRALPRARYAHSGHAPPPACPRRAAALCLPLRPAGATAA